MLVLTMASLMDYSGWLVVVGAHDEADHGMLYGSLRAGTMT
jgi:hypothetical protein